MGVGTREWERSATTSPGGSGGSDPKIPLLSPPCLTVPAELGPSSWLFFSLSNQPERKEGLKGLGFGWAGEPSWRMREVCPEDSRPGRNGLSSLRLPWELS